MGIVAIIVLPAVHTASHTNTLRMHDERLDPYAVEKSRDPERRRMDLDELAAGMRLLPFDKDCALAYGAIRALLERKGVVIGPMDLLIAAQAVAFECVLVTGNLREFRRVSGLQCENWLR